MDEEIFNIALRRFLKKVGISSQREIELAVREAVAGGRLTGSERLAARMTLELPDLDLTYRIDGDISLSD